MPFMTLCYNIPSRQAPTGNRRLAERAVKPLSLAAALSLMLLAAPAAGAAPLPVVAAENFYGDIARQIGGPQVTVTSILSSPDQDPHLFEASPSVARAVAAARIVIYNGLGYDPWIEQVLRAVRGEGGNEINVGALVGKKPGDNPHIWYDPTTMPVLAKALAAELGRSNPSESARLGQRLAAFLGSLRPIDATIAALRRRLAGTPVTATEPVFGYMLQALGMADRNTRFQLAVMNNTEPSAADVAAFENDLRLHRVRLLIYNSQATDPVAQRMLGIAKAARLPVVGVTETEPPGLTYQGWVTRELNAVAQALLPQGLR
jgi:zinc/manganese transport system substrate-binding protein